MKNLAHMFLIASLIALAASLVLAIGRITVVATANGWLDLALVLAVIAIAIKTVWPDVKHGG